MKGGNLLIAVVESLFILLFATNKVFLNIFDSSILPVNIILENNFRNTNQFISFNFLCCIIVCC